jgi:SAM-dependent methyltransferase
VKPQRLVNQRNCDWGATMGERLFKLASDYDAMLDRGLRFSGEGRLFFIAGRVAALRAALDAAAPPSRILDFGCGTGETSVALAEAFSGASVVGVDASEEMLWLARQRHSSSRLTFCAPGDLRSEEGIDLCYVNGVLHHVEPSRRGEVVTWLHAALRIGGSLAVFENNPANPGTRLVMARIPFDRDAHLLSPREARRLLAAAHFGLPMRTQFLFVFPRWLRVMRPVEARLRYLPFGAQYLVLAVKSLPVAEPRGNCKPRR